MWPGADWVRATPSGADPNALAGETAVADVPQLANRNEATNLLVVEKSRTSLVADQSVR
jgi:hypothetical protein